MSSAGFYEKPGSAPANARDLEELNAIQAREAQVARRALRSSTRGVDGTNDPISNARRYLASMNREGVDHVEEARRQLERLGRPTGNPEAIAVPKYVEDARRQLAKLSAAPTRGIDHVEEARRELAQMRERMFPPTRGLDLDREHQRSLEAVEKARRDLARLRDASKTATGNTERVCLHQEAALKDLENVQRAGGVENNIVIKGEDRFLRVTDATGAITDVPMSLTDRMLAHATRGCIPGDDLISPCANCAQHM